MLIHPYFLYVDNTQFSESVCSDIHYNMECNIQWISKMDIAYLPPCQQHLVPFIQNGLNCKTRQWIRNRTKCRRTSTMEITFSQDNCNTQIAWVIEWFKAVEITHLSHLRRQHSIHQAPQWLISTWWVVFIQVKNENKLLLSRFEFAWCINQSFANRCSFFGVFLSISTKKIS